MIWTFWGAKARRRTETASSARAWPHINVESRETTLGPGVHAYVRLGQDSDTGYAPIGREMVQMDVQKRRPASLDTFTQGSLHARQIAQMPSPPEIQDKMNARKTDTLPFDKMVLGFVGGGNVVVLGPAPMAGGVDRRS